MSKLAAALAAILMAVLQLVTVDAAAQQLLVRVHSDVENGRLRLVTEFGPSVTLGVKIYSEPSHTLLFVAADPAFADTADGAAWLQRARAENALAIVKSGLPASRPSVEITSRPAADDVVTVSVARRDPDGTLYDWTVSRARTTAASFAFSTSLGPAEIFHHCCEGGGCPEMCVDCRHPEFTCCLVNPPACCEISCQMINCCPP